MQLARSLSVAADRLDELGRVPLVRFDYRGIPGPSTQPPMTKVAVAFPTWNEATATDARDLGWDEFWAARPAGASRLIPLAVTGYDDAVRAAHAIALTTRPGTAPGDKQAHAVLELPGGRWYAASLGGIADEAAWSAWLLRMGTFPGYHRPTATALVPELRAVLGGASIVDLRGRTGPVPA